MISYSLKCKNGHAFDGWFRGSDDFDAQVKSRLLVCPVCGDEMIEKALMAPNVSTTRDKAKAAGEVQQALLAAKVAMEAQKAAEAPGETQTASVDGTVGIDSAGTGSARTDSAGTGSVPVSASPALKDAPEPVRAYVEAVRKLRAEVEATAEDVGAKFADEARKMHHGDAEERPIRGEATFEEAVELDEEGIDVFVLPVLPEDRN